MHSHQATPIIDVGGDWAASQANVTGALRVPDGDRQLEPW